MCTGFAVPYSTVPLALIEPHDLADRLHDRGGEREFQFHYKATPRTLPVWDRGGLAVVRWGVPAGASKVLPASGFTWLSTVEAGKWAAVGGVEVVIPAYLGFENGVWFGIREGVRGILVQDEKGIPTVYLMVEPASHYYEVMTRCKRMPCLVGERI